MPVRELNDNIRRSQPIETRHITDSGLEARLVNLEQWVGYLENWRSDSFPKIVGEALGEEIAHERDDTERHVASELRRAIDTLSERLTELISVECGLLRQDLVDRINIREFGSGLANEGLEHLKSPRPRSPRFAARPPSRSARWPPRSRLSGGCGESAIWARPRCSPSFRRSDQLSSRIERTLGAKVEELAAENRSLRADFEGLCAALGDLGVIQASEPARLPHHLS